MKIKEFFAGLLEDNSGGFSSIRFVLLVWFTLVFVVWTYTAFHLGTVPDIPSGTLTFSATLAGSKVVQRFGETYVPDPTDPADQPKV